MAEENTLKAIHGQTAQDAVEELLDFCVSNQYLFDITAPYNIGADGYNSDQFYAPFMIRFNEENAWLLYSTTSCRDRIKQNHWDSFNIKRINNYVSYSFLIYPSETYGAELKKFLKAKTQITNHEIVSALDDVLNYEELFTKIEKESLSLLSGNQYRDRRGKMFEARVAETINYYTNYVKWRSDDETKEVVVGLFYPFFEKIVDCFGLNPDDVVELSATTDIPKLPSGGQPKTDVVVTAKLCDGKTENYTISCKATNSKSVSAAQFSYETYANAIAPGDEHLKELLRKFQTAGSDVRFKEMYGENISNELGKAVAPYIDSLIKFVLGGYGLNTNSKLQLADYLLTYNDETQVSAIHTLSDYAKALEENGKSGQYGTPFQWTYQGDRGTNIQMKMPIL